VADPAASLARLVCKNILPPLRERAMETQPISGR
jgi:hypothetical protein